MKKLYCRCAFIVNTLSMSDSEIDEFIDEIKITPGITDGRMYFGLNKKETDGDFLLSQFIRESLSNLIYMIDTLNRLKTIYVCDYILDIRFSDIEKELENGRTFILDDTIKNFLDKTGTYYNLNDGYFE